MTKDKISSLISIERVAQDMRWGIDRELPAMMWLAILIEEVGELAKTLLEEDFPSVTNELVQVAAVAHAWLERLDS